MKTTHNWKFFRAGGFDQVKIETGADLMSLDQLDQKLWVALACPTTGLHFDVRTMAMIDTDKDGRIRPPELMAAAKWAGGLLKNPDDLVKRMHPLPLAAINDASPEGKILVESSRQILANLGKKDATSISVEDLVDTGKIFAQTAFNGDGIIVEDSAADAATRSVITDILATMGAETDRSGKPGVSQAKVDAFYAAATAFSDWWKRAEADSSILAAGDATPAAAAAVRAVKAKVDDYFARCRLAAFDGRAIAALNREEKEFLAMAAKDLTITAAEIAGLPLARIEAGKPLSLTTGVNPAWAGVVAALAKDAVTPLLGAKDVLTEADWAALQGKIAGYEAWMASKGGTPVEKLGLARVRAILDSQARESINALLAKDKAEEFVANSINSVEKLVRLTRDLHLLATNFVNFKDFYDRGDAAIFQAGVLYLDQRSCELTLRVEDAAKHVTMAGLAGAYLAYCDCVRKSSGEKMGIVAIFSQGDDDNLMVGRNGVFYDRFGRDWDATITKIVANPISLRQAFFSPYKKFARMIEEQVAKRASAAESASTAKLSDAAAKVAEADKVAAAPTPPAKVEPKKVDVGTVAALGVAFGAIGTFAATIWAKMMGLVVLGPLAIVGAIVAVIILISTPSLILAYIKLRKRNLGPILDSNGWAVNARAKINVPFGTSLTGIAKLPAGAQRDLVDPYAEKKSIWPKVIVLVVLLWIAYVVLNYMGYIYQWSNGRLGKPRTSTTTTTVEVNVGGTNTVPTVNVTPPVKVQ